MRKWDARRSVYRPVPSHRLGRSLGVDLVPLTACAYDCTYSQLGRTTHQAMDRRVCIPVAAMLARRDEAPTGWAGRDHLGLAGWGEPTLHANIGNPIDGIQSMARIPVAVLANGSLLWKGKEQDALLQAGVSLPFLDAASEGHRTDDPPVCEGRGVRVRSRPAGAIDCPERRSGDWMVPETRAQLAGRTVLEDSSPAAEGILPIRHGVFPLEGMHGIT
jgi:hypothetical protein